MKETDLYPPVKKYLEKHGYEVYGEVINCDITAKKGNEIIVVEMRTSFSVKLLLQAVDRQEITDSVYIALPVVQGKRLPVNYKGIVKLLKRLELGLLLIRFMKVQTRVEAVLHPDSRGRKKNGKRQRAVIREIDGRFKDFNVGGSSSLDRKITAYRENAIQIAVFLSIKGEASPAELRRLGTGNKTGQILHRDFYGWFERVKKGVYTLHENGRKSLKNYREHVGYFEKEYKRRQKEENRIKPSGSPPSSSG